MSTTRQLLHLFEQWRNNYGAEGRTLVCDGPIGGDAAWETSPLRIVFLLKEPHDRNSILEKCGYDLTELFRRPELYVGNRKSAERVLGRWAYCLQQIHAGNSLRREFDILQPDVVVCGGTYRTASIVFPELQLLNSGCQWVRCASCVWINHVHPSCRESNSIKYDKLFAAYRSSLCA